MITSPERSKLTPMNIHVIGLPFYPVRRDISTCAYTQKVRRFANMMSTLGHDVHLYAPGEDHDTLATFHGIGDPTSQVDYTVGSPTWVEHCGAAITALRDVAEPDDILGLIAGQAQQPIADALPELVPVEWGIGYSGTFAPFRAFESYAWMHAVQGGEVGDAMSATGRGGALGYWGDAVIPNSYEAAEFPWSDTPGDYLLYVGRLVPAKGLHEVAAIAARTDRRVLIAGQPMEMQAPAGCEYVGVVNEAERAELMGGALALLTPTLYVEPFGGVAVEAMMCGTPVISTDWGAFTETVQPGVSGYRCRTLREFLEAVDRVGDLDRAGVRRWAEERYDTEVVKHDYDRFLRFALDVRTGAGWYEGAPSVDLTHDDHQEWEAEWWGDCANTYSEEAKQTVYARHMGLTAISSGGQWPCYDIGGRNVLDIGGGPASMLLKTINRGEGCAVVDPCDYPEWVSERYGAAGIDHCRAPGEEPLDGEWDEVWIYNVLQHVEDPEQIIKNAQAVAEVVRIFEWVEAGVSIGHPHDLKASKLDEWLGGEGTVAELNEAGCVGRAYYGVFTRPNEPNKEI